MDRYCVQAASRTVGALVRAFRLGFAADSAAYAVTPAACPVTDSDDRSLAWVVESFVSGAAATRPLTFVEPARGDDFRRYVRHAFETFTEGAR